MKKSVKNFAVAMLIIAGLVSMSSCNRGGYGCPYELKAATTLIKVIK